MRILFITATYLPTVNGVSYQISILKQGLEKLGNKVFVLAPSFPGYTDLDKCVIRYPSLPNPFIKKYPLGIPYISLRKIRKIKPDIVHTHHPSIIGQAAGVLSDTLNIPLFFTAHTQYEKYLHEYFPQGKKITSRLLKSSLRNLSQKCHTIICPSVNTKKRFEKMGIKNSVIIHNSIETEFFHKPIKKDYKIPTLVYTGRIDKEKNPLFLVKIAKELKKLLSNFHLLILGDGALLNDLTQKIYDEKLQDNILVAGDIARNLLPSIYKSCHLFITPSLTEVMPLSIIEAMASGLPIIALKKSELEDVVINNKTGFLLPKDTKIISKKISYLFKNPKVLNSLVNKTYKHSLNFSVMSKAKELDKLYLEAISGN